MSTTPRPLSDVSKLPFYGRKFPFVPFRSSTEMRVTALFYRHLYAEVGLGGFLAYWLVLPVLLFRAWREGRAGLRLTRESFGYDAALEWVLLMTAFRWVERKRGSAEAAYDWVRDAIQDSAPFEMADLYPADEIAEFEDPFEAFWAYHVAMFRDDPNYPNDLVEDGDVRIMVVHSCRNCEIAAKTIPELAPMGCDHDIVGYPAVADRLGIQFRRPTTLAKDGQPCRFMFFRAGTPVDPALETH